MAWNPKMNSVISLHTVSLFLNENYSEFKGTMKMEEYQVYREIFGMVPDKQPL